MPDEIQPTSTQPGSLREPTVDDHLAEFDIRRPGCEALCPRLKDLLRELLDDTSIRVHSVEGRVKTRAKLETKLRNHQPPYSTLDDVTDLVGNRIITFFLDDVDRVADIIEAEFEIDRINSVDRRATIEPDRFGYVSLHYIASLSEPRASLPEWKRFARVRFEIQVRSIVQHAWAEIEHDLGYHAQTAVPAPVRRRFSRLAGLLEVADSEFMGLRGDVATYVESLPASVETRPGETSIDQESMLTFIDRSPIVRSLDLAIAKFVGLSLEGPDPSYAARVAQEFTWLGLRTIGEVSSELATRRQQIRRFTRAWITDRTAAPPRGASVFFLFLILATERSAGSDTIQLPPEFGHSPEWRARLRAADEASAPQAPKRTKRLE